SAEGALAGALCALVFFPVFGLVLGAAREATAARAGSIVAASDRRVMWGLATAALAVLTVVGIPEWLLGKTPRAAIGVALGASARDVGRAIAGFVARRRAARAAIEGEAMEVRDEDARVPEGQPLPELDFGLGDEVRTRVAPHAAAYRGRERVVTLFVGDPA